MLLSLPFEITAASAGSLLDKIGARLAAMAAASARMARALAPRRRLDCSGLSDHALRDLGLDRTMITWLESRHGEIPRGPMG